jgi:acetyltransferase
MSAPEVALVLANDEPVRIRPIRPDDEAAMAAFHRGLSDLTVYQRYFHMMRLEHRITHERLARICHVDDTREAVLVMLRDGGARDGEVVGVARLTLAEDPRHAEFAVLVTDGLQGAGAGPALTRALTEMARGRGVIRLRADILRENVAMQKMCARLGMTLRPSEEPGVVCADLAI